MKRNANAFQPQLNVDCYHIAKAPVLHVRKVTLNELLRRWVPYHPKQILPEDDAYYIQCDRHGLINWRVATIYTTKELIGRNNVYVITFRR